MAVWSDEVAVGQLGLRFHPFDVIMLEIRSNSARPIDDAVAALR